MKTCLFAGSGFSKSVFDQKLQSEFIEDFITSDESKEYIKYFSHDLKKLMLSINDPEILISHFFNLEYTGLPHDEIRSPEYEKTLVFIRTAIAVYSRNKFNTKDCLLKYQKAKDKIRNYINSIYSNHDSLSIVTTNYDLGFEIIFDDIFGKEKYFYPKIHSLVLNQDKIKILKLHGSINWLEERGRAFSDHFWNLGREIKEENLGIFEKAEITPLKTPSYFALTHKDKIYTPVLIPFMYQKGAWNEIHGERWKSLFLNIWKISYESIVEADKLVFIGYGPADHGRGRRSAGRAARDRHEPEGNMYGCLGQHYADLLQYRYLQS